MKAPLAVLPALTIWPFDETAAFRFGMIFPELRKQGRPMQTVDMTIAAVAMSLTSCLVVTTYFACFEEADLSGCRKPKGRW